MSQYLIPHANVAARSNSPYYAGWLVILAENATRTDAGWLVADSMHGPLSHYLIAGEFTPPDPIPPKPVPVATQGGVKSSPSIVPRLPADMQSLIDVRLPICQSCESYIGANGVTGTRCKLVGGSVCR